jgi:NAD+ kinase
MQDATVKNLTIAFVSNETGEAEESRAKLVSRYGSASLEEADVVVALGGDGLMLMMLHRLMNSGKPIYGMNRGTIGFLMNEYREDGLRERIASAVTNTIHPLAMTAHDVTGAKRSARAINEVSLLRQSYQAAKLRISTDGRVRIEELICDGALVATPAGSTAYNLSAHGPIIPINAPLLALTPLSPFRPRLWRGALLPDHVTVRFEVIEADKRPVNAVADHTEFKSVTDVTVHQDRRSKSLIMFDPDHSWDERILNEQFRY